MTPKSTYLHYNTQTLPTFVSSELSRRHKIYRNMSVLVIGHIKLAIEKNELISHKTSIEVLASYTQGFDYVFK